MPTTSNRRSRPRWLLAAVLLPALATGAAAAPPDRPDAVKLAARIDKHLADGWAKAKVAPAPEIDDAGFARRCYLDLVGRIRTEEFFSHAILMGLGPAAGKRTECFAEHVFDRTVVGDERDGFPYFFG